MAGLLLFARELTPRREPTHTPLDRAYRRIASDWSLAAMINSREWLLRRPRLTLDHESSGGEDDRFLSVTTAFRGTHRSGSVRALLETSKRLPRHSNIFGSSPH